MLQKQDMRSFAGKSHRKSGKKVLAMRSYLVYNHICCEKRWSSVTICVLRTSSIIKERKKCVGVEKTWPLHSPHVVKVEVIRHGKVRRAKLNYLRDRVGKAAKVKELVK